MRVAVYTNTRVTFQCCTSVHKGFVTAFRGGQVLGFVLVGGGVLNIMIIIFIFKAGWYNGWLKKLMTRGVPVNQCPGGQNTFSNINDDYDTFKAANTNLVSAWATQKVNAYHAYLNSYREAYPSDCPKANFPAGNTFTALASERAAYQKANIHCTFLDQSGWEDLPWSTVFYSAAEAKKDAKVAVGDKFQQCTSATGQDYWSTFCKATITNGEFYADQSYTPAVAAHA